MWRTVLLFSVLLYTIVSHVTTAPAYDYYPRGPSYFVNHEPEATTKHKQPYLEVRNATYHGSGPREEARAMCSVKTQEVNATANATITRRLHGVVTSTSGSGLTGKPSKGLSQGLLAVCGSYRGLVTIFRFDPPSILSQVLTRSLRERGWNTCVAILACFCKKAVLRLPVMEPVVVGELHSSIQRLEVIIYGQMQQLWKSMDALRTQLVDGSGGAVAAGRVARAQFPDRHTVSFSLPSRRLNNRDYH